MGHGVKHDPVIGHPLLGIEKPSHKYHREIYSHHASPRREIRIATPASCQAQVARGAA